jgi:hypothetical protein
VHRLTNLRLDELDPLSGSRDSVTTYTHVP